MASVAVEEKMERIGLVFDEGDPGGTMGRTDEGAGAGAVPL
jgi:hypothetical protein